MGLNAPKVPEVLYALSTRYRLNVPADLYFILCVVDVVIVYVLKYVRAFFVFLPFFKRIQI